MDDLESLGPPPDTGVPAKFADALQGLVDRPYTGSPAHFNQHARAVRAGAHPDIVEFERRFIKRFARLDIPMFAHSVVRTHADQTRLFVQGHTKAQPGASPHNFGMAVDLVHSRRAWDLVPLAWSLIGHIGKEVATQQGVALTWGGNWKFYDPAHWELSDWRNQRDKYPFQVPSDIGGRNASLDYYLGDAD